MDTYDDVEELFYDAVRTITLLVEHAGGEITISEQALRDASSTSVLQRFWNHDGSVTYRVVEPE